VDNASLHPGGAFMVSEISALDKIKASILGCQSFVLQGGAGCGKTETLKQLIDFISLDQPDKKLVCITHTNKAVAEINSRINGSYVVSTIHSFLNSIIKDYKKNIHAVIFELFKLGFMERLEVQEYADVKEQKLEEHNKYKKTYDKYASRYFTVTGIRIDKPEGKRVYDASPEDLNLKLNARITELHNKIREAIETKGFKSIKYNETPYDDFKDLTFGHDGLLVIASLLFDSYPMLGKILNDKFDYIFIDEYQDTQQKIISLFLDKLPEKNKVLIGLFGDSMQSIYGAGIGDVNNYIQSGKLRKIEKKDNFRCSPQVIKFINTLRDDGLVQKLALKSSDGKEESEESRNGNVEFFYAIYNNKPGTWTPVVEKNAYTRSLTVLIDKASFDGNSKTLILSNKAISVKAGFAGLYQVFSDRYSEPREKILQVLTRLQLSDLFEICDSFINRDFNSILAKLRKSGLSILKGSDKKDICDSIQSIIDSEKGAVATIEMAFGLNLLKKSESFAEYKNKVETFLKQIDIDPVFVKFEADYNADGHTLPKMRGKVPEMEEDFFLEQEKNVKQKEFYKALFVDGIKFPEVLNYFRYEDDQTPYITMHKTKGTGIDNVLVVLDENFWNEYDFKSAFDPNEKDAAKAKKNMQLIYVACSRAKLNLRCVRLVTDQEEIIFQNAFKIWDTKKISLV
jgi:DNA helicase II / ATP-dependent DNA helicase PcrA